MKNFEIRWLVCALFLCAVLTGCGTSKTLSLEEALLQNGQSEFVQDETNKIGEEFESQNHVQKLVVYVCGSVNSPGVYELPLGSRIVAAVEVAGGFTIDAATEAINLAERLSDGIKVRVPSLDEVKEAALLKERAEKGLVNINKADEKELCTLPGIGSSKALSIIAHREENGPFQSVEEIRDVSGIGENLYLQIEDRIYIE